MHTSLRKAYIYSIAHFIKELEVRYSLLNLSVYNLVEKYINFFSLLQSSSYNYLLYNNTLIVMLIKNNNNLLNTINLHIKLRKLKEVCEADILKQKRKAKLDSLLDSNNYYLDSSLDINSKDNLENKKAIIAKNLTRE
ncbi:hypothetical protein HBI78_246390 [Parastagonospora nodorum]|nr:hypothetical protein HBI78_246390 [Parastagonospora nodorum]